MTYVKIDGRGINGADCAVGLGATKSTSETPIAQYSHFSTRPVVQTRPADTSGQLETGISLHDQLAIMMRVNAKRDEERREDNARRDVERREDNARLSQMGDQLAIMMRVNAKRDEERREDNARRDKVLQCVSWLDFTADGL